MKEYFIVSDIHAKLNLLTDALSKAGFSINNENHILTIAGDILDRGLEGDAVIRFLEELIIKDRVIMALGNHDIFFLDLANDVAKVEKVIWNIHRNGFGTTLQLVFEGKITDQLITVEFLTETSRKLNDKYPVLLDWLRKQPFYLEFNNHIIVHGFLDFIIDDWHNTSEHDLVWKRGYNLDVPESFKKKIIIGHTPNTYFSSSDDIVIDGKKIMIDGGAAYGHQVNVLKLNENEI